MLAVPFAPEFGWRAHSHAGRPVTSWGATVTPGNNTKGSYAAVQSALAFDCHLIEVYINSTAASAVARDTIVDIGIDPAGGSSYTPVIPNLLASFAGNMTGATGPIHYTFPLFIPAGSTIAARASVNNATVGTANVFTIVWGKPKYPELWKAGLIVESVGAVTASSCGTAVTPGTTSDGSWASLGTVTRAAWWWQCGWTANDSTLGASATACDLSAGGSGGDKMLLEDLLLINGSGETMYGIHPAACTRQVAAGSTIYARCQGSGAADSNVSMIAYALS